MEKHELHYPAAYADGKAQMSWFCKIATLVGQASPPATVLRASRLQEQHQPGRPVGLWQPGRTAPLGTVATKLV